MVSYYHCCANKVDHPQWALAKSLSSRVRQSHYRARVSLAASPYVLSAERGRCRSKQLFVPIEHFSQDSAAIVDHLGFEFCIAPRKPPLTALRLSGVLYRKDNAT